MMKQRKLIFVFILAIANSTIFSAAHNKAAYESKEEKYELGKELNPKIDSKKIEEYLKLTNIMDDQEKENIVNALFYSLKFNILVNKTNYRDIWRKKIIEELNYYHWHYNNIFYSELLCKTTKRIIAKTDDFNLNERAYFCIMVNQQIRIKKYSTPNVYHEFKEYLKP